MELCIDGKGSVWAGRLSRAWLQPHEMQQKTAECVGPKALWCYSRPLNCKYCTCRLLGVSMEYLCTVKYVSRESPHQTLDWEQMDRKYFIAPFLCGFLSRWRSMGVKPTFSENVSSKVSALHPQISPPLTIKQLQLLQLPKETRELGSYWNVTSHQKLFLHCMQETGLLC